MTQYTRAASADCDANSDFVLARDGSRKHEAAEIGACDGENEQREYGYHRGDAIHLGLHDLQVSAGRALDEFMVPDGFRVLLAKLIGKGTEFLLGDFRADAGCKAAPHATARVLPVGEGLTAFDEIRLLRHRHPDLRVLTAKAGEGVWGNSNDGGRSLVDVNDVANDVGIAGEAVLPEFVAEDDGGWRCR